jgi:exodeoxyribonuclease VII small subunit
MSNDIKDTDKIDFESSLKELEEIVEKLGNQQVPLDDMVNFYQKGVELKNSCLKKISNAKLKVENILSDK